MATLMGVFDGVVGFCGMLCSDEGRGDFIIGGGDVCFEPILNFKLLRMF